MVFRERTGYQFSPTEYKRGTTENWSPINRQEEGGGGNHKNNREPWGGGGKGKCYHETTKFPLPTPTRGLNNDRFLNKVTKREGSWEVGDDDLTSFCRVTVTCIQKC